MQQSDLSSCLTVTSSAQARAFEDPLKRRLILYCAQRERSASDLADRLAVSLQKVHYHLACLVDLALLRVASEAPRKGRAIKHYRAEAAAFFIPRMLLEDPNRQLRASLFATLDEMRLRAGGGTKVSVDADGKMRMELILEETTGGAGAVELCMPLRLSKDEMKDLQQDIAKLVKRAAAKTPSRNAPTCYFHMAMAPKK